MACGSANEPVDYVTRASAPANSATSATLPTNVLNGGVIVAGTGTSSFNGCVFRDGTPRLQPDLETPFFLE